MKEIIILGSSRSDGNSKKISEYISTLNTKKQIIDLNDYKIGFYDYDNRTKDDDYLPLIEQIISVDTFIFVSPVYWYAMSAQMKTFFDRFTDLLKVRKELGQQLRGKNMKVICCSSNAEAYPSFWKPFELSAAYLGMQYLGHAHTWIENDAIPDDVKNRLKELFE